MIQHSTFHDGSFVLHKVMVGGQKYSAWYNKDGSLKDCERIKGETSYSVPERHRLVRDELGRVGRRYTK